MYCSNCGTQLADDAKFCTNCGARQTPPGRTEDPEAQRSSDNGQTVTGRTGASRQTDSLSGGYGQAGPAAGQNGNAGTQDNAASGQNTAGRSRQPHSEQYQSGVQPPRPAQSARQQYDAPVGQPSQNGVRPKGVSLQTYPMVFDILYGIDLILTLIGMRSFGGAGALSVLSVILGIAMLVIVILDLVYLSNIGIRGGWKWSVLIYPLYLFLRAQKTDGDKKWAIINLIEFVIGIILAIVSVTAAIRALTYYAYYF